MKITAKCLLAAALLVVSEFASAAFMDGNTLYARLNDYRSNNTQNYISSSAGTGYVLGVADAMDGKLDPATGFKFCIPKNATQGQLTDITLNYLQINPADRHLSAWSLVAGALQSAFPCR